MPAINENTWSFVRMGRKPMFKQPEDLEVLIREYFEEVEAREGKLLISGLAGIFGSWDSLYAYQKKEGFKELIGYARLLIEQSYEANLSSKYTSGAVFALKNIGNWVDKTEQAQTVEVKQLPSVNIDGNELVYDIGDAKQIDGDTDD